MKIDNYDVNYINIAKQKSENISLEKLQKRLSKKKFLYQYLPNCLESIKDLKYVEYKGQNLKPNYLIDIVHNLLLKYYFKKENSFALNAVVLKDKYGYLYNYYIKYLIDANVLNLVTNYKKGFCSRKYSLNTKIIKSRPKRINNFDKVLLKKYKKKIFEIIELSKTDKVGLIDESVKQKLVNDLFFVEIDIQRSIFYLDVVKDNDWDIYNRNLYAVESINNKHIFFHFDTYGRMHTNYTILKSFIRKNCLLISGEETFEIDISNSQPLFLSKLINDSESAWVDDKEFELFKLLTRDGKYYQFLQNKLGIKDKKKVKELTYKVLFGRNASNSIADKQFKSVFPTIHKFITLYKSEHKNYKVLAYDLQKMESNLIFNNIIKNIIEYDNSIEIITVHDSIIVKKKHKDLVNAIFQNELNSQFDF